ncbi:MAG: glycosyltransferase family 2 protein, partial [Paramuribaculum sp.]|nr:glycosyltransferase family 2 protein [Paramuribaculum sp.]
MKKYSVIVPVYNRIDEVRDLLQSLSAQTFRNFEVIIVEDGS